MDINSLRDAMMKYMSGINSGSTGTFTPINPTTGERGPSTPTDMSFMSNLKSLLGMGQSGQVPTSMAGPQGSMPRQAMEIDALKKEYMRAVSEGNDQRAMQIEEAIRQMQNPGQVQLPPSGGQIGI